MPRLPTTCPRLFPPSISPVVAVSLTTWLWSLGTMMPFFRPSTYRGRRAPPCEPLSRRSAATSTSVAVPASPFGTPSFSNTVTQNWVSASFPTRTSSPMVSASGSGRSPCPCGGLPLPCKGVTPAARLTGQPPSPSGVAGSRGRVTRSVLRLSSLEEEDALSALEVDVASQEGGAEGSGRLQHDGVRQARALPAGSELLQGLARSVRDWPQEVDHAAVRQNEDPR